MRILSFLLLSFLFPLLAETRTVLWIGVDGFRHDYADIYQAKNLLALRGRGAGARTRPVTPSSTFPNFYSMVTGLTPDQHGIVAMHFYDRSMRARFDYNVNSDDGRFYRGNPLWNRVKTGTYFWPGSSAEIGGARPWRWFPYDSKTSHEEKIKTVLSWLALPEAERPRLAMVYFADVDVASHTYGVGTEETRAAVQKVDASIGRLVEEALKVLPSLDIVVVSDHGMIDVKESVDLAKEVNLDGFTVGGEFSMLMLYNSEPRRVEEVYLRLRNHDPRYKVVRRRNLPSPMSQDLLGRIGDLVVVPTKKPILLYANLKPDQPERSLPKAMHGYNSKMSEMRGICYAAGPHVKGRDVHGVKNTADVNRLIEKLLELPATPRR